MKKTLLGLVLGLAITTHFATAESAKPTATLDFKPLPQQVQAANIATQYLTRAHYKAMPLDDAMSEKIFDRYLKSLDGEHIFFLQADIDEFSPSRMLLDDAIFDKDLSTPFAMFNRYHQRFIERITYAKELLKGEFDFAQTETYQFSRDKETWLKTSAELDDLWRKRVKNDWLRLKIAGKEVAEIRKTLERRYETYLTQAKKRKSEDIFQIFMNAYALSIDPHTNYLGPKAAEDFDISMSLSMSGIGATLQERDEMATVRELIPGSPAALSGKLKVGDRIVGVAQGADGQLVDVMGWRLDDVVALIRGPKDSTVLLDVLPADAGTDGAHKTVILVRNKITLEQQAAKKTIQEVKTPDGVRKIGVIELPTFYLDIDGMRRGNKDYKSATRDVAKYLEEFKKAKVDSVLIDLRNNGGGSLIEAIELSSLFIGKGPVVQQRYSRGEIQVEGNQNGSVQWEGPMGVLINRGSASASEIFAAAIQDYGRGLIIGESSFGKGTVQNVIDIDRLTRTQKLYGELKLTIAQFFRVNGGTTQLRGVTPDIAYPSFTDAETFGEASYDNALPWVQIKPAEFKVMGNLKETQSQLQVRHEMRIAKDLEFQFIKEDIAEYKKQKEKKTISLNEAERRQERDAREEKMKKRETLRASLDSKSNAGAKKNQASKLNTQDDGLQVNERSLASELAAEKASKEAKDVYLIEAAHILSDEVDVKKSNKRLAERQGTKPPSKRKEVN